jgi:hypothetical protein
VLVMAVSTKKRAKNSIGAWLERVTPVLLLVAFLATQRQALAASLVRYSSFEEVAPSVFVEPGMPSAQREHLLEVLAAGRARVAGFYGTYSARPVIIVGSNMDRLSTFASNSYASTHYSPLGPAVVFGPDGQDLEVVSHELAHAELFARVGWWRMLSKVPTWFDEGLAMQFDHRTEYGDDAYAKLAESGGLTELERLTTARRFFDADAVAHYVQARHEVGQRRAQLKHMVDELVAGAAITSVWR